MEREKPLIVVADDDDDFREVVVEKLTLSGFDVCPVKNGDEAVAKTKELKPDLILMDISMPGKLNGVAAAMAIKADPEAAPVKIAFLSAAADPWPAFEGNKAAVSKALGMMDFIPKDIDLDALVGKVSGFLGAGMEIPKPPTQESV